MGDALNDAFEAITGGGTASLSMFGGLAKGNLDDIEEYLKMLEKAFEDQNKELFQQILPGIKFSLKNTRDGINAMISLSGN